MGTPQFYIKYAYEMLAIVLPLVGFILCREKITSANRFANFLKWSLLFYVVGEIIILGSDFIFTRLKLQIQGLSHTGYTTLLTSFLFSGEIIKIVATIIFGMGLYRNSKELKTSPVGKSIYRHSLLFLGIYLTATLTQFVIEPYAVSSFLHRNMNLFEPAAIKWVQTLISLPGRILILTAFSILVKGCYIFSQDLSQ